MRKILVWALFLLLCRDGWTQDLANYLKKFAPFAVREMERTGIPASIKLGQGILESSYGNSLLAQEANNHFGIKCGKDWSGPTFDHDDDRQGECFRKYDTPWHSFRDHSEFLKKPRYSRLFSLSGDDYKAWAKELKRAGYATAGDYAERLISRIEEYRLWRFDKTNSQGLEARLDSILAGMGLTGSTDIATGNLSTGKSRPSNEGDPNSARSRYESACLSSPQTRIRYHENDGLKYIVVKEKETLARISLAYDIPVERLMNYNDLSIDRFLIPGQYLFLETKSRSGAVRFYKVNRGEDMYTISQKTGIRLEKLYYRNRMEPGEQVRPGDILYLQGRKEKTS